jgi:uncharacterized OsmC-like protein
VPGVAVGFDALRMRFDVSGAEIPEERVAKLVERTEKHCVLLQTLLTPPAIATEWSVAQR